MRHSALGHNVDSITLEVRIRLFNSLSRFTTGGPERRLAMPAGSTVGDILSTLGIPRSEVCLVLCNGRDVTPSLHGAINTERAVEDGDVVALSGPVPYSWGYGSPVV